MRNVQDRLTQFKNVYLIIVYIIMDNFWEQIIKISGLLCSQTKVLTTLTCETMAAQPREDGSRFLKKPPGLCDGRRI